MKTAVSLPDNLFKQAESTARKLKMTRSRLYATALKEFIDRRKAEAITQKLNEVYSKEPAEIDPALYAAQLRAINLANGEDRW